MSLRWRFALLFAGGVVIVTVAVAAAAVWTTSRSLLSEVDSFLEARLGVGEPIRFPDIPGTEPIVVAGFGDAVRFPGQGGRSPILPSPDSILQVNRDDGSLAVVLADTPELPAASPSDDGRIRTVDVDGTSIRVISFTTNNGYSIQVGRDLTETEAVLDRLQGQILLIGLILAAFAFAAGWLLARRLATPLEQLSAAADRIAGGEDLGSVAAPEGSDEVGRLGHSFNTMVKALANSKAQQRRLVQDASHELRTPLTSLRTNIEVLQRNIELGSDERAKILDDLDVEVRELSDLVTELVELASDVDRSEETPQEVDLATVATSAAQRIGRRTGRRIDVEGGGEPVSLRPSMIERATANLIENAHKWSPEQSPITVSVSGRRLAVLDDGPGIPADDINKIFERFYRADTARSTPGSGLGLAIVAQIVEAHGGTVFAHNRPNGGAEVGFEL